MKYFVPVILLFCFGCEGENIMRCGYACKEASSRMISYSKDKGCICESMDAGRD